MVIKELFRSVPTVSQAIAKLGARGHRLDRKSFGNGARSNRDKRFHLEVAGAVSASRYAPARTTTMPRKEIVLRILRRLSACLPLFSMPTAAQQAPEKPVVHDTPVVHDIQEMAKVLDACIRPLPVPERYKGIRIAARLGFNTRGQPLGPPRFTYITPKVPARIKNEYKTAILDALVRCTPVPFSRQLGATIAGEPFVLTFDERGLMYVRLAGSSVNGAPEPLPASRLQFGFRAVVGPICGAT